MHVNKQENITTKELHLSKTETENIVKKYLHFGEPQEPFEVKATLNEATARILYSRIYTQQRSLSRTAVGKIYADLKKGNRYPDNVIHIAVMNSSEQPFVVDGQHRLAALVKLAQEQPDFSFPCRLYLNYPKEQLQYIDQQRPRTANDIVKLTGRTHISKQMLSIPRYVFYPYTTNPQFSRHTVIECCNEFYDGFKFGVKEYQSKETTSLYLACINAVQVRAYYSPTYRQLYSSNQEYLDTVERFFSVLGSGLTDYPDEAKVLELRIKILEHKMKFGAAHQYFFALTQIHLSAFLKGNKKAPRKIPVGTKEDGSSTVIIEDMFPCPSLKAFYDKNRGT